MAKKPSKQASIQYYIAIYFICFAIATVLTISVVAYYTIRINLNYAAYHLFDQRLTVIVDNIRTNLLNKKIELEQAISTPFFTKEMMAFDKGQVDLSSITNNYALPGLPQEYKYQLLVGKHKTGNYKIYPNTTIPHKFAQIFFNYPDGGIFFADYKGFKGWIIFCPIFIEDKVKNIIILQIKYNNLNDDFTGLKYKRVSNKMIFEVNSLLEITAHCKRLDDVAYYDYNDTEVEKRIYFWNDKSINRLKRNAFYFIIIPLIIIQLLMVLFGVLTFRRLIIKPINTLTQYIFEVGKKKSQLSKDENLRCKELKLFRDVFNRIILKIRKREEMLVDGNVKLETSLDKLTKLQQQLIQNEKMASLGRLTSGVAHEINNPLNSIGLNISAMRGYLDDIREGIDNYNHYIENLNKKLSSSVKRINEVNTSKREIDFDFVLSDSISLLDESGEALEKILKISSSLKSFSLDNNLELEEVKINKILDLNTKILLSKLNSQNITIIKDFNKLPSIIANPENLNHAFMQILENAYDAVKKNKKGIIEVKTELQDNQICLEFHDNGCGIPNDIIDKIFDPFFTTKDIGEGVGLGLHLVYKIIKAHNGNISVTSSKEKGTCFKINIPLAID